MEQHQFQNLVDLIARSNGDGSVALQRRVLAGEVSVEDAARIAFYAIAQKITKKLDVIADKLDDVSF